MYFFRASLITFMLQVAVNAIPLATCPRPDSITPCSCHDREGNVDILLYCSDERMSLAEVKHALNAFKGQSSIGVELDGLNLGVVPSDFFRGVNVKMLDISQCQLESLSGGGGKPLEGLENTLEELTITASINERFTNTMLTVSHLKSLREFNFNFNSVKELGDDWFKQAPTSLRRITISSNDIISIGKQAFADVRNLEYLSVDGNRFGPLTRSMLPNPANELDTLELDNNGLTNLPDDIFTNMPYLKIVSLTNNGLLEISENAWKNVWGKLDNVDLRGNPLNCNSRMEWISQTPTCADIYGVCISPRHKSGQNVPVVHKEECNF